jgi:hypothetical protein
MRIEPAFAVRLIAASVKINWRRSIISIFAPFDFPFEFPRDLFNRSLKYGSVAER